MYVKTNAYSFETQYFLTLACLRENLTIINTNAVSSLTTDDDLNCAICHVEYEMSEKLSKLPCTHFFHPTCITIWLKKVGGTYVYTGSELHLF